MLFIDLEDIRDSLAVELEITNGAVLVAVDVADIPEGVPKSEENVHTNPTTTRELPR